MEAAAAQPLRVGHLIRAAEDACCSDRREVAHTPTDRDHRCAIGAPRAADERGTFPRRIPVVGEHVDGHRLIDERGRGVVTGERWLAPRLGQDRDGDVARHLVAVAVVDRVGEPRESALIVDGRRREPDPVGRQHVRPAAVTVRLADGDHHQRIAVGIGVVGEHVDVDRAADHHGLGVGDDERRPVRFRVLDHLDEHRAVDDMSVAVVDGVLERNRPR